SAVAAVRPVSENSVAIYLTTQSQFVELDDGTWSLAVWPQAKARPKLRRQQKPRQRRKPTLLEQVAAETRRVVEGRRERRIKLGEMVAHMGGAFLRVG